MPTQSEQDKSKENEKPMTPQQKRLWLHRRALRRKRILERRKAALEEDNDDTVQGLGPGQLQQLAQKVVDLWRNELRIEDERFGRTNFR